MKMVVSKPSMLAEAASQLLGEHRGSRIFALYGELGAGKTTFIKELCRVLGCSGPVVSPTFTLINEYLRPDGEQVFHFDFYRIEKLSEAYDFGIEEYLTGDYFCFLEWPEKVESILPADTVKVKITVNPDGSRTVET
ncbi:MAG: tRNA (adenosine(37)-N6)-threonylcarbamoyltransferase complex ATPase subunit type 1 TsaE [Bacteroidales bacterium]|jgi:tRNA threonylcarbamoyladenosine biosynthesis protein TsaE|nr:tRNA (adenosine(37)-N6)-threonylcarbamoyltransferase complex ATPase subunit type 1 TsaE [Bacteroidales bacterium]